MKYFENNRSKCPLYFTRTTSLHSNMSLAYHHWGCIYKIFFSRSVRFEKKKKNAISTRVIVLRQQSIMYSLIFFQLCEIMQSKFVHVRCTVGEGSMASTCQIKKHYSSPFALKVLFFFLCIFKDFLSIILQNN